MQSAPGPTGERFHVSRPAGVIRLLRVTVPHGTRANITGVIPGVAAISISAPQSSLASEDCQRRGAVDVCTEAEPACPMPAARWQFRLDKLAGPAGQVRLDFVVA